MRRWPMIRVRHKLILLGALVVLAVSTGFTWLNLSLAQRAIEEDLKRRAIVYAREVAATLADSRRLEGGEVLGRLIARLLDIRRSVLQLEVVAFSPEETVVVATSHPGKPLPFVERDADEVRNGRVVAREVTAGADRHWGVMAPIALEGSVAGAVAVKFSSERADELASRIRFWAVTLAAASVVLIGVLMSVAIQMVVDRPIRRFMDAISSVREAGVPPTVDVSTTDEFGVLAREFNEMVSRIGRFNEELRTRVAEATGELDRRNLQLEQLNALLFEMQRRLSHAERLGLSARVMAEVAHEVGTPLHSVAGHLELLRKDVPPAALTEDSARRLTIIETQVRRVIEIITRLLDVTRRAPGEPEPVDLERLARDTVELVRPGLTSAGVALAIRAESGPSRVRGRPEQLQQVILNLLTNAIDATPGGGRIEVTTRALPEAEEVEIAVTDTGHGISAADQKQIFEPFFSTKEPGRGTGLGLFITAEIVREHKGRIEIDSEVGRGSTFRVALPAAHGMA
jgi:two-component system NtrC family sensor kinase